MPNSFVFIFLSILPNIALAELSDLKLPLPVGEWKVNTEAGGYCDAHCKKNHFSIDFDDGKDGVEVRASAPGKVKKVNKSACDKDNKDITSGDTKGLAWSVQYDPSIHVDANSVNGFGNFVRIEHGNSYDTLYGHLRCGTINVKEGDDVSTGTKIGEIGNSGRSKGSHLHFQVYHNDSSDENDEKLKLLTMENIKLNDYKAGRSYSSTNILGLTTEDMKITEATSLIQNSDLRTLTFKIKNSSDELINLTELCIYSKVKNYLITGSLSEPTELSCKPVTEELPPSQLSSSLDFKFTASGLPDLGIGEYIVYPVFSYTKNTFTLTKQHGGKSISILFNNDSESYLIEEPTAMNQDNTVKTEPNGGFNNKKYSWTIGGIDGDEVSGIWAISSHGKYEIKVFIPTENYVTPFATYYIFSGQPELKNSSMTDASLSRGNAAGEWVSLGTYLLEKDSYVDLHAATGMKGHKIAYSAMLFIKKSELNGFPDVPRVEENKSGKNWVYDYANEMKRLNIIKGRKENDVEFFAPEEKVTNAEFLTMALRLAHSLNSDKYKNYNNDPDPSIREAWESNIMQHVESDAKFVEYRKQLNLTHWALPDILFSIIYNHIPADYFGLTGGTVEWYNPDKEITRYKAIELLAMLIDFKENFPSALLSCSTSEACKPKVYFFVNEDDDYYGHKSAQDFIKSKFKDEAFVNDSCVCESFYNYLMVKFFYDKNIMNGKELLFSPNNPLTRAEAAKILSAASDVYESIH